MKVIDYNGEGVWSVDAVLKRYTEYVRVFGITEPRELTPVAYSTGDTKWIYSVMDRVIEGIEAGDSACAELGVEFIQTPQEMSHRDRHNGNAEESSGGIHRCRSGRSFGTNSCRQVL